MKEIKVMVLNLLENIIHPTLIKKDYVFICRWVFITARSPIQTIARVILVHQWVILIFKNKLKD